MSKSRRVFLSIQGNDDFWGNGDRLEERKVATYRKSQKDEMDDKYFFKQSKLGCQQEIREPEKEMVFEDRNWKLREVEVVESKVEKGRASEEVQDLGDEEFSVDTSGTDDEQDDEKPSVTSFPEDENDIFYKNYRNFFRDRSEVTFLIRSICKNAPDELGEKFIDLYEKTRKRLESVSNTHINSILRPTSSLDSSASDSHGRSRNAVVVSNFREPDRRLGRYSKYYYHHNVGPEVYSRKVFVGGLPACVTEDDILGFFSRYGRLQVDWPSKHYGCKSDSDPSICHEAMSSQSFQQRSHLSMASPPFGQINPFMNEYPSPNYNQAGLHRHGNGCTGGFLNSSMMPPPVYSRAEGSNGDKRQQQHLGYVFLLFEKERSVRDLVSECIEEEEGLFITLESSIEPIRVQIRPWLLADAEFLMDFNVPINTKLVAFIGGVPRPLKAVELAHFFEQTYGNVVCVGIDIDNKFKYPRGSGRVAFSNYDAYVQAITDRYIVLDHEDIHKKVEIKPYFFHNQSCEECSGRYHRQHAPFFCPSLECFQYYCEPCWHKMHAHPSRFHHMPVVKGI